MMNRMRQGFTLLEMIVAMTVATIVLGACTTFVLMCLRMQNVTYDENIRDNEARVAMGLIEDLADQDVKVQFLPNSAVIKKDNKPVLSYIEETTDPADTTETNGYIQTAVNGNKLIDNVEFTLDVDGRVLTANLKDNISGEEYTSKIYCRQAESLILPEESEVFSSATPPYTISDEEKDVRYTLLKSAAEEYDNTSEDYYNWYAEKYFTQYLEQQYPGLESDEIESLKASLQAYLVANENSWGGCFVLWNIMRNEGSLETVPSLNLGWKSDSTDYSLLDFVDIAKTWDAIESIPDSEDPPEGTEIESPESTKIATGIKKIENNDIPIPGDLIFVNSVTDIDNKADHVGIVTKVEGDSSNYTAQTIEIIKKDDGTLKVSMGEYKKTDSVILGCARLDWKEPETSPTESPSPSAP